MTLDYARLARAVAARGAGESGAAFVRAAADVDARERAFAAGAPDACLQLLALDAAYQAARAEVAFRTGDAPPAVGLTGPYPEIASFAALSDLVARVRARAAEPWAAALIHEVLGPAIAAAGAADPAVIAAYNGACRLRADTAAPAMDALGLSPADLRSAHETSLTERDRPCAWPCCVVAVRRVDGPERGSGVFLTPSLVITAAHVAGAGGRLAIDLPAPYGGARDVRAAFLDAAWRDGRAVDRDIAILQVDPAPGLGLPVIWDFAGAGGIYPVARYGRPPRGDAYEAGHVERARHIFVSKDLHVPDGASGGGLFFESGGIVYVVGVTTNEDPVAPGQKSFIGLPLLPPMMEDLDTR